MKNKFLFKATFCLLSFILFSCSQEEKSNNIELSSERTRWELSVLSSESELNSFISRGDENIVDWQLSKEFAELYLEDGITNGEYPEDSELWEIPIAIYSSDGNIKYYEFRIVSNGSVIGAITGSAIKDYGCPILYEFLTVGYADELEKLYNLGSLSEENIPRIIDDGYPSVAIGLKKESRGNTEEFESFVNLETGAQLNETDILQELSYEEVLENNNDYIDSELDENKSSNRKL